MTTKTYPEMNEKIVGILQIDDSPHSQYAAQRIKELESNLLASELEKAALVEALEHVDAQWEKAEKVEWKGGYPILLAGIKTVKKALKSAKPMYEARLKEVEAEIEFLKRIEWTTVYYKKEDETIWECLICGCSQEETHNKTCELALRIEKLEAELKAINEKLGEMG